MARLDLILLVVCVQWLRNAMTPFRTEHALQFGVKICEGLPTIVSKQREDLRRLHAVYVRLFNASGPLSVEDANAVDLGIAVLSEDRQYSLQLSNVTAVLEDLGLFVAGKIEKTGADAMAELVKGLALCTVNLTFCAPIKRHYR